MSERITYSCCGAEAMLADAPHKDYCSVPEVAALDVVDDAFIRRAVIEFAAAYDSHVTHARSRRWAMALDRVAAIGRRLAGNRADGSGPVTDSESNPIHVPFGADNIEIIADASLPNDRLFCVVDGQVVMASILDTERLG